MKQWYWRRSLDDQVYLATYNDQQKSVIVEGIVVGEPDARDACDATNLSVEVNHLLILRLRSGQTSNLPASIPESGQAAFCTTGTSHIIAISG